MSATSRSENVSDWNSHPMLLVRQMQLAFFLMGVVVSSFGSLSHYVFVCYTEVSKYKKALEWYRVRLALSASVSFSCGWTHAVIRQKTWRECDPMVKFSGTEKRRMGWHASRLRGSHAAILTFSVHPRF